MMRAGVLVMLVALGMAGCGKAPAKNDTPVKKYVLTSIAECVEMAEADEAACGTAIDAAITRHTQTTPYLNARLCEKDEGADRCEKLEQTVWLAKPQGFLVLRKGDVTQAVVLYAVKGKSAVFRTADQTTYDPDAPAEVKFSKTALRRADAFASRR